MAQQNQVNLDMEGDPPSSPPARAQSALSRLDESLQAVSRQAQLNRNNLGTLGDRIHHVFREIRPLVESARMGNNSRLSLPIWRSRQQQSLQTNVDHVRPESSIAHVNLGPASQTYIVTEIMSPSQARPTLSVSASHESNLSESSQEQPDVNVSVNPANNNNIHDRDDSDNQSEDPQLSDLRSTLRKLLKYAPFYVILFLKFIYDMREGLFAFFVLLCTFMHCNTLVRREHGKQMNRSFNALVMELFTTIGIIGIVHYLFGHDILLPNVVMFPGYTHPIDVWELLWLVTLTDLIVRIITVDIKILVTLMPAVVLPFQKRGKVYLFVEAVSQLYRSLLTIQPWMFYLIGSYDGPEKLVGMFLTSVYVLAKLFEMFFRIKLFKDATWTLLQSVNLGTKPTGEQLLSAGDSCPICHDDYTTPVRLGCSHIFCELCIAAWLDREHTCPLCRAKVTDEPTWRDGSTTYDFQLY